MQTKNRRPKTKDFFYMIYFCGLLSVVCGLLSPSAFAGDDWLEGASGYKQGVAQSKSANKPMVVMFYTDWCGYCRKLQKNVLSKSEVEKALSNFVKVRINPETGDGENQLAEEYGIQGYPTVFFEKPGTNEQPVMLGGATRNAQAFIGAVDQFLKS